MADAGWDSFQLQRFFASLARGGASAAVGIGFYAPIERVKLLLQVPGPLAQISGQKSLGVIGAARSVSREQGVTSFWRGSLATFIRYYPAQILSWGLRGRFHVLFPSYDPRTDFWKAMGVNILAGGLANAVTLLLVYPLDLARTRMALDVGVGDGREFSGVWDCLTSLYKSGGLSTLFWGYGMAAANAVAYRGLFFIGYDLLKTYFFDRIGAPSRFVAWLGSYSVTLSAGLLSYPFHAVSRNLMMQAGRPDVLYQGTLDCIRKMFASGGIGAFFGGSHVYAFSTLTSILTAVSLAVFQEMRAGH